MSLIEILLIILVLSTCFLCVFVMIYMKRIYEQAEAAGNDIRRLVEKALPLLNHLEEIAQRTNRIEVKFEGYLEEIDSSIRNLGEKISNSSIWKKLQGVQSQASEFKNNFKSVAKGVSAFLKEYTHR